jgi:hypothetical protein
MYPPGQTLAPSYGLQSCGEGMGTSSTAATPEVSLVIIRQAVARMMARPAAISSACRSSMVRPGRSVVVLTSNSPPGIRPRIS